MDSKMSEVPKIPPIVRERMALRGRGAASGEHPDANLLAAFAEQSLTTAERDFVLEHASRCAECRAALALAADAEQEAAPAASPRPVSTGWPLLQWKTMRWTALATGIAAVLAIAVLYSPTMHAPAPEAARQVAAPPAAASQPAGEERELKAEQNQKVAVAQASLPPKEKVAMLASPKLSAKDGSKIAYGIGSAAGAMTSRHAAPVAAEPEQQQAQLRQQVQAEAVQVQQQSQNYDSLAVNKEQALQSRADSYSNAASASNQPMAAGAIARDLDKKASPSAATLAAKTAPSPAPASNTDLGRVTMTPAPQSETIQVTDEAKPGATGLAPEQARPSAAAESLEVASGVAGGARMQARKAQRAEATAATPRWRVHQSTLQESLDFGTTWQDVRTFGKQAVSAIAVIGSNVWIGVADVSPAVLHSADNGEHWSQQWPQIPATALTTSSGRAYLGWKAGPARVTDLEFEDARRGKIEVTTETKKGPAHQIWRTTDGGASWTLQSEDVN